MEQDAPRIRRLEACTTFYNLKSAGRSTRCSKFPSPSSKKQNPPTTRRRFNGFGEFHAALFQFNLRRVNRVHAQRDVAESGELVVAAFRQWFFRRVNFKPAAARQRDEQRRRILAVGKKLRAHPARVHTSFSARQDSWREWRCVQWRCSFARRLRGLSRRGKAKAAKAERRNGVP